MKKSNMLVAAIALATFQTAQAGGILTNTNQSVDFLRNPARDAAIGLDGVYSNPAGVAFMPEGLHLAFNWQYAHQTRTVTSTHPLFALGKKNAGATTKTFEGVADAPCVPSVQAAWNKNNWSIQFNFSMPGGGGVCEYSNGLGSFESAIGQIAYLLNSRGMDVQGYDADAYMRGRQYYFGFTLGAAYKINEHLSVYGGLRALYGDASYKARISNIQVRTTGTAGEAAYVDFGSFLNTATGNLYKQMAQAEMATAAGLMTPEAFLAASQKIEAGLKQIETLQKYSQGVNLMSIQTGFGIAPIVGVDYRIGPLNLAAKYEANTQMRMRNHSTLEKAMEIEAVNKYQDGTDVDEDAPALLTIGAQWSAIDALRISLGYHHYFDKNAHWYNNAQDKLDGNTNEYLAGVEWDLNDKFTISGGGQLTRYGLSDDYMNDMSFVVNSYSLGFGGSYKISDHVKVTAAYFQTNYDTYDKVSAPATETSPGVRDQFTRTNRVLGLGVELTL